MTVIRPNSVSGITSITAQANEINVFRSNGLLAGLNLNGVNFNTTAGISTLAALKVTGNLDVEGVLTYQDVTNVDSLGIGTFRTGINVSGGQLDVGSNIKLGNAGVITATSFVGSGANLTGIAIQEEGSSLSTLATTLNFVGGNITASGSGASKTITVVAGAGGTFAANAVGVHTTKIVGINTTTIAGSATSEGALQVRGNISIQEGLLTLDSNIHTSVSIGTGRNAMLIGPTTVAAGATIDIATGSTLVVV